MRAGPEEIPWSAPGGGEGPRRVPAALGLLWVLLWGPIAGVLAGVAATLLLALDPERQAWGPFAFATVLAVAASLVLARQVAAALLKGGRR